MCVGKWMQLSKSDMEWVHQAAISILNETGFIFRAKEAVEIFKNHGAKVEGEKVFFSESLIEQALESAPKQFKWRARNKDLSVIVGDDNEKLLCQPNAGAVFIQDNERGRRSATLKDFTNIIKICQYSDLVNLAGSFPVDPVDVPFEKKHLLMMHETLRHTDKPIIAFEADKHRIRQIIKLSEIACSREKGFGSDHYIAVAVTPTSPLSYELSACETIIEFAKKNQIIFFTGAANAGFTAPVSLIGTIIIQHTEILAGIILAQLVNSGNPVVYSCGSSSSNMKNGIFMTGTPDMMLIHLAGLKLGKDYCRLPVRSMCGMTDSKIIDCQAGYETMQNLLLGVMGGAHIVFECLGVLDAIMTTSYEKLIIDMDILGRILHLKKGLDTKDKEVSLEAIKEVGPLGSFIDHESTLSNYRQLWQPTLSEFGAYQEWLESGAQEITAKASKVYQQILSTIPNRLVDGNIDRQMISYIDSQ